MNRTRDLPHLVPTYRTVQCECATKLLLLYNGEHHSHHWLVQSGFISYKTSMVQCTSVQRLLCNHILFDNTRWIELAKAGGIKKEWIVVMKEKNTTLATGGARNHKLVKKFDDSEDAQFRIVNFVAEDAAMHKVFSQMLCNDFL